MSSLPRGVIGVVHLPAMPGDPRYTAGGFGGVCEHALADAKALLEGGVDAIVVENFGSVPFRKGSPSHPIEPHQVAAMALVAAQIRSETGLPIGVNCLRNDAVAAIGIAAAAGLAFVRVNVHCGAYITDQGLIEGDAAASLRYRASLGTEVGIAADVLVKHATPVGELEVGNATADCFERGLADAVIVTGVATGAEVPRERLARVREVAGARPVWIGSGLTASNAAQLAGFADAAIIGTAFKHDSNVRAPVDVARVREIVPAVASALRR